MADKTDYNDLLRKVGAPNLKQRRFETELSLLDIE